MSIGNGAFSDCSSLTDIKILNPECEISDDDSTISNRYDENYVYYFNGTIYGYDNSTAQEYAEKYGYKFESLGKAPVEKDTKKGDANGDGTIDVADVVALASYVGNPDINKLDEEFIKSADVHNTGDGITANDALMVQQYIAKIIDNL